MKNFKNIDLNDEQNFPQTTKNFVEFYNLYNPYTFSNKLNNTFTHKFFNYKKNYGDLQYKLITSDL